METVKGIPYGLPDFMQVRKQNAYYVDKTMYLPMLEAESNYLFLIRPRRFGKSLFVSMMRAYYDLSMADRFDELFGGLWIHEHPTPLKNSYQIIYFDFSQAGAGTDRLEYTFNDYCCTELDAFILKYEHLYEERTVRIILESKDAASKLRRINAEARRKGYALYLIIDEYDNFTNVVLSEGGKEMFRNLTHASGFYREYFKIFKAMFDRVFMIGVSPVTLDDLTSGYNIGWNISLEPEFNYLLGFSETDVRAMFTYYQQHGVLRPEADIEGMMEEMKPWYNNYCFSKQCLDDDRIYNCDMVLYYLRHQAKYGRRPEEMVDVNVRTDYKKLEMLAGIDHGNRREDRMGIIEEIASTGSVLMTLNSSFPAEYVTDDDNFRSLLYYYGLLTIESGYGNLLKMVIPNKCVKEQYWSFMRAYFNRSYRMDLTALQKELMQMAFEGDWRPLFHRIATAYKENSSVRDSILGEHNLQGFFKAYLALSPFYLVEPEIELNHGYSDFLLLPDRQRYPDVAHSYILELKYVSPQASDAEVAAKSQEADGQLRKYSQDKIVKRLCAGTRLHLLKMVFRGAEIVISDQ